MRESTSGAPTSPPNDQGKPTGVMGSIRAHRRTWLIALIAIGLLILGTGSVALGLLVGRANAAVVPVPTPSPTATLARPVPSALPAATRERTCSVAALAQDARLGTLEAQVLNPKTGEVLFDRSGSTPAAPGSVVKTLTGAAALATLGPDYRIQTRVVAGSTPGQIVIVGGGDVTLSRLPDGQASFYTNAPTMQDLATQTLQVMGSQPITSIVVDTSLFSGPVWQPTWDEHEERVVEGSTPYMTALMVDGDRDDPTASESPRSTDPVGRAVQYFQQYLGTNVPVSSGVAPAGARQLAVVQSQPVSVLIDQALTYSDNTIMEALSRLVAIKQGTGNTFSAENAGVLSALQKYGIPTTGIHLADGSGLSGDNAVPPSYLTQFFALVMNRQDGLGVIYDGLPISGETGTLGPGTGRFAGANAIARGAVHAKTGSINNSYDLAGIVTAADGTPLTFAVYALGNVSDQSRAAIDTLVTGFYSCGNNLSNN